MKSIVVNNTLGNWFYINARFVVKLIDILEEAGSEKERIKKLIIFAHDVEKQKKVNIYRELALEIKDILQLEQSLKKGSITWEDEKVFVFIRKKILYRFTHKNY